MGGAGGHSPQEAGDEIPASKGPAARAKPPVERARQPTDAPSAPSIAVPAEAPRSPSAAKSADVPTDERSTSMDRLLAAKKRNSR